MKNNLCECGRRAVYSRHVRLASGDTVCVRGARTDHPMCKRCYEAQADRVRALALPRPPVPAPKGPRELQAGRLLQNLAEIERMGFKLDGLKDIRDAHWALLRSK